MPTYRYETDCGCKLERVCYISDMEYWESRKPACTHGSYWRRDWSIRKSPAFKEGWYEHLSEKPVYIDSMQQLKRVAKDNGVYSQYAEDMGSLFKAKEGRWV